MAVIHALVPAQGLPIGSLVQIGDDDAIWSGVLSSGSADESEYTVTLTINDETFTVPGNALISILVTGIPVTKMDKGAKKDKKPKGDKKNKGDKPSKFSDANDVQKFIDGLSK